MKQRAQGEPEIAWRYYDRVEPGDYLAHCTAVLGPYFDKQFRRHTCLILWDVYSPDFELVGRIRQWLNLGSGDKPHASRRGHYWKEWTKANGERAPGRNDRLSPRIFRGRLARVAVGDTKNLPAYSVVRTIHSWETGIQDQSHSDTQTLHHSREARGSGCGVKDLRGNDVN